MSTRQNFYDQYFINISKTFKAIVKFAQVLILRQKSLKIFLFFIAYPCYLVLKVIQSLETVLFHTLSAQGVKTLLIYKIYLHYIRYGLKGIIFKFQILELNPK